MPIIGRFGSLAGLGSLILPGGAMESIATVTVGSGGASSITFSDIPGGFQHLQVRGIWRITENVAADEWLAVQLNGDTTGGNYAYHSLYGAGASATAEAGTSATRVSLGPKDGRTANVYGAFVVDILDYASTSKNTVMRTFGGYDANGVGVVGINSTLWKNTNAVTSLTVLPDSAGRTLKQYTAAALYGLRAP